MAQALLSPGPCVQLRLAASAALTYQWTSSAGTLGSATAQNTALTCTTAGLATVTLAVSDGDCTSATSLVVTCTGP